MRNKGEAVNRSFQIEIHEVKDALLSFPSLRSEPAKEILALLRSTPERRSFPLLLSDQRAEFIVGEGEIANTRGYIRGSIADMQSLLVDVENNIPKDEALFKKVEDDKIRDRCNFRKVCVLSIHRKCQLVT